MTAWRWGCALAILAGGCGGSNKSVHEDMGQDAAVDTDMAKSEGDGSVKDASVDAAMAKDAAPSFVDGGVSGAFAYQGTSPGSTADTFKINVDHDANTINVSDTNTTTPFTLAGSIETLASGFLKINLTKGCNGAGCTPAVVASVNTPGGGTVTFPSTVHAIEAPGYLMVIVPDDGPDGTIGAVAQSDCVAAELAVYNAIPVGISGAYNLETGAAYQQITLSGTAVSPAPTIIDNTINASPSPEPTPGPGTCAQGVISFNGGASSTGTSVYESGANGALFAANGSGNNAANIGLVQSAITLADLENHTYAGFYFAHSGGGSSGYVTLPFASGNAAGVGREFTTTSDVDSNSPNPDDAKSTTITFTGVSNGIVTGTLSGSTTGKFKAAALKAGNVNILVLIADQNGDGTDILNLILVSH